MSLFKVALRMNQNYARIKMIGQAKCIYYSGRLNGVSCHWIEFMKLDTDLVNTP